MERAADCFKRRARSNYSNTNAILSRKCREIQKRKSVNNHVIARLTVLKYHEPSKKMGKAGLASAFCKIDLDEETKLVLTHLLELKPNGYCIAFRATDYRILLACVRSEYFIDKGTVEICFADGKDEFKNIECHKFKVIRSFRQGIDPKGLHKQIMKDLKVVQCWGEQKWHTSKKDQYRALLCLRPWNLRN